MRSRSRVISSCEATKRAITRASRRRRADPTANSQIPRDYRTRLTVLERSLKCAVARKRPTEREREREREREHQIRRRWPSPWPWAARRTIAARETRLEPKLLRFLGSRSNGNRWLAARRRFIAIIATRCSIATSLPDLSPPVIRESANRDPLDRRSNFSISRVREK